MGLGYGYYSIDVYDLGLLAQSIKYYSPRRADCLPPDVAMDLPLPRLSAWLSTCLCSHLEPLVELICGSAELSASPRRHSARPETPRVCGHRFSAAETAGAAAADPPMPNSPMASSSSHWTSRGDWPPAEAPPVAPQGAAHVFLIDPGSGEVCGALQGTYHVHLAVAPSFDLQVHRYPPNWRSMRGVHLSVVEAQAAADAWMPPSRWPSVASLRGPPHPQNLASWASELFDAAGADGGTLAAVPLSETGADRSSARHQPAVAVPLPTFRCLCCGSRGGEVTLPALWLLGCRLPAVVINGGCAREQLAWAWPVGVPVVLLTGGRDPICNEFHRATSADERDRLYTSRVWGDVPAVSRATTALVHLPLMAHRPDEATLRVVLPCLLEYAAAALAPAARPSAARIGHGVPCILFTAEHPLGEWIVPLGPTEPPPPPPPSRHRKNRASWDREGLVEGETSDR